MSPKIPTNVKSFSLERDPWADSTDTTVIVILPDGSSHRVENEDLLRRWMLLVGVPPLRQQVLLTTLANFPKLIYKVRTDSLVVP